MPVRRPRVTTYHFLGSGVIAGRALLDGRALTESPLPRVERVKLGDAGTGVMVAVLLSRCW